MSALQPCRILVLPGGGVRGIFQAMLLDKAIAELRPGRAPHQCFDLVCGTSTGAILALAIALGVDLQRVATLYKDKAPDIFSRHESDARWILGSLWKGEAAPRNDKGLSVLRAQLQELFAAQTLGSCKARVIIPATDLSSFTARVFDSANSSDAQRSAVDVALASAAAPGHFPAVTLTGDAATYIDGGLWANSPLLAAISGTQSIAPSSTRSALIVGNGKRPQGLTADQYNKLPALELLTTTLELMFACQEAAAEEQAKALLGAQNVVSVNVALAEEIALDDASRAITTLPGKVDAALQSQRHSLQRFFS